MAAAREIVDPRVSTAVLLERLERSPTLKREAREIEDESQRLRARFAEERQVLLAGRERAAAPAVKRLQSAQARLSDLDRQRAAALAQVGQADLELQSVTLGTEVAIARFERELERTASPRIDEFQRWLESELAFTCACMPPFVTLTAAEYDALRQAHGLDVARGGYDQDVRAVLVSRTDALRLTQRQIGELKFKPLSEQQVINALIEMHRQIPPLPSSASTDARFERLPVPEFIALRAPPVAPAPDLTVTYITGVAHAR